MSQPRICTLALILMLLIASIPVGGAHAAGTDEIKSYAIDILPQQDGSLLTTYAINWCVISNSAGPLSWITLGMPNEHYQVVSSSGEAASVQPYDQNFNYQVRIDLPRQVNAGDCVNFSVQVHQYGLASLDQTANTIGFHFTPGWFDEVPVDQMKVTWHLPADATLVKSFSPQPASQKDNLATWEKALQPGEKYPLTVVYDKAAFPNFNPNIATATASSGSSSSEIGYPTEVPATSVNTGGPGYLIPSLFTGMSASTCLCLCLIALLVLFILFLVFRSMGSAARSYHSGGFFGGYSGGGGWLGGGGGGLGSGGGGGSIFTPRTGGGSGLFGGRGMSCACVSSGCACACAGGGRAGCSRKGFDVSSLFKEEPEKDEHEI